MSLPSATTSSRSPITWPWRSRCGGCVTMPRLHARQPCTRPSPRARGMIARAETSSVIRAIVEAGSCLFMDLRFALLLPDASGDLICVAAHGPNTEGVLGFWVHKGQGLAGRVFETARPVLTGDVQAEAGSARKDIDDLANFHSYMAVPLMADSGHYWCDRGGA